MLSAGYLGLDHRVTIRYSILDTEWKIKDWYLVGYQRFVPYSHSRSASPKMYSQDESGFLLVAEKGGV